MTQPHVLILGGGIAGFSAYRALHAKTHKQARRPRITLVNKKNYSLYVPMLHEVATGAVERTHITQPIREMMSCCHDQFIQNEVANIDLDKKQVGLVDGQTLTYDVLVVALGSGTNYFGTPGAAEHAFSLRWLEDAVKLRNHFIRNFERAAQTVSEHERCMLTNVVIIGGGPSGVETAGQVSDLFHELRESYPELSHACFQKTLVQSRSTLLPHLHESLGEKAKQQLEKLGVTVLLEAKAMAVHEQGVELNTGKSLLTNTCIWTAGVRAPGPQFFPEKYTGRGGRILVTDCLQMPDHKEVFVIGDVGMMESEPGPHAQTAQVATQQGEYIAGNIVSFFEKRSLKPFRYKHKGELVPIGDFYGLAEIRGLRFSGFGAWWLRRTVFLQGIVRWRDRLKIIADWTIALFAKRNTTEF